MTKNMVLEVAAVHWTIEEFQAWQAEHLTSRVDQKRWIVAAKRLLGSLNIEPNDLLGEAIFRILIGKRQLNRSVTIEANLFWVMKSIASSWHKRRKRKPEVSLEELLATDDEASGDVLEVLLISNDDRAPSPEEELAYKQELDALQAVFADRPDAQMVILGRAEGLKGAELAAFADLNASQLATVQRLISRRFAGYRRDA
jgi:DNA-directed RNA polymerase specialized sigma24 family protein